MYRHPSAIVRLICWASAAWLLSPQTGAQAQTFANVSTAAGFTPAFLANIPGGGIAVADYDRNGFPDIFVTGYLEANRLYFNQGNGTFVEVPAVNATLPGTRCSVTAAADYDNDGWPDLYVGCRNQKNYLLRNLQGAGFADVTPPELDHNPPGANPARTDAVSWGDLDGNGLLDLFIGIYPNSSTPNLDDPDDLDRTVLHNSDGSWTNVFANFDVDARAKLGRATLASIISDLDRDGRPDIYVVNDKFHGNTLWHNDGPGCGGWCFSDISVAAGAAQDPFGMGVTVGDVDRNGVWDLYFSSIDEQFFLRGSSLAPLHFQEEPTSALNHYGVGWGVIFSDFDNDGWEDAYLACGSGSFSPTSSKDQVFHNSGGGQFISISAQSGLAIERPTQAAASIDLDRDGHVEMVLGHWNQGYNLYRNTLTGGGNWIGFELTGDGPVNRDAIGAVVTVETADGARQIRELRSGESRGSSNDPVLHFGIGGYTRATISIRWPDGTLESVGALPAGRYYKRALPLFKQGFED